MNMIKKIWNDIVEDAKNVFNTITDDLSTIYIVIAVMAVVGVIVPNVVLVALFVGAVLALIYLKYANNSEDVDTKL